MEGNVRSLFSKTLDLDKQLRTLLRQDPQPPTVPALRERIRESYKAIILGDFEFALAHDIEQNLWKIGFYKSIEEYRKAVKKCATTAFNAKKERGNTTQLREQLRKKCGEFRAFLAQAMAFYEDLIQKLTAKYNLALDGSVVYDPNLAGPHEVVHGTVTRSGNKAYLSCHKCYIFLGDLTRYHRDLYGEPESSQRDWSIAEKFYYKALEIVPDSGNPHNQLAVVATYRDDDLEAVYRYFRSLAVKIPFATANDNLRVLFDKNKDKLHDILDPQPAKNRQANVPRREKSPGPPDEYKIFALRFVRLHGILFTSSGLELFEELKEAALKHFEILLARGAFDLTYGTFTVMKNLSKKSNVGEGEDSLFHQAAYLLTLEMTTRIARATPCGDPHPASPHLTHISVFLDWAMHHHSLLHPLVQKYEGTHYALAQALVPVFTSIIRSTQGSNLILPPTLPEEFDLSAFIPLSTTFCPVPPPAAPSSLPQRLAKLRSALNTLVEEQPNWAFLLFDEGSKTFTATSTMLIKSQAGTSNAHHLSPLSSTYSQQDANGHGHLDHLDGEGEDEEEDEDEEEEDEEEDEEEENGEEEKAGVSMDLDSPSLAQEASEGIRAAQEEIGPPPLSALDTAAVSEVSLGSPCEFNDDEVAADDDVDDEVILFNPFSRPNQSHHVATPIGGERRSALESAAGSLRKGEEGSQQHSAQNEEHKTESSSTTTTTSEKRGPNEGAVNASPSLYVPPHRQGLDFNLRFHDQRHRGPSSRSPPRTTPPRKRVAPPPGFPSLPPGFSAAPPVPEESLFSSFQPPASSQGEKFTSFFGLGSPIAPSHVAYPFSYRQQSPPPSGPPSWTSPVPATHPPPRKPQPVEQMPPSSQGPALDGEQQGTAWPTTVTSVPWPFAPHRAQEQQQQQQLQEKGSVPMEQQNQGWTGGWQLPPASVPPQQWNHWQGDPTSVKTSNPFLS